MERIRTMTMEDYEAVYDLWIHTPGMGLNTLDDSRDGIGKYLRRNPSTCFVAEEDGTVIGAIIAGHDGRRGYIYHLAVRQQYRKRGIGKRLTESVMEALEKEGIHKVALVALTRNDVGNGFWEAQGFSVREDLVYRNKEIHELQRMDT